MSVNVLDYIDEAAKSGKRMVIPENKRGKIIVSCKILGTESLILDPLSEEVKEQVRTKTSPAAKHDTTRVYEVQRRLIINNGYLTIPGQYLINAIVEAGRYVKNGKKQISTAETTTLFDFLTVMDKTYKLGEFENGIFTEEYMKGIRQQDPKDLRNFNLVDSKGKPTPFKIDSAACRANKDYSLVPVIRPQFDNWSLEAMFELNTLKCHYKTLFELIEKAGSIGLGAHRPTCKGPHGQFRVSEWEQTGEILEKEPDIEDEEVEPMAKKAAKK